MFEGNDLDVERSRRTCCAHGNPWEGQKASSSRDMLSALECRVANLGSSMRDVRKPLKIVKGRTDEWSLLSSLDKFEFSKPKEKSNGGGYHKEDGNSNGSNGKNGGKGKPHNGNWKPNNNPKGLVKCFICDGPHMVMDCTKKSTLSAIEGDDEPDKAKMRLGSMCILSKPRMSKRMKKS
ncbi:hypothetical protein Gohar_020312 [Gossypium harknessii]|uniref:Uncharacterized protein n=1 Tax=Gossypium harknessii TaxID=34285 RepID=A0A7J9HX95_9ROSI|nr:hypothetical protein [Gossypium harknessii]